MGWQKTKIAVLGINYRPEATGISAYTTEMCEYLAKKGHTVHVYTGFPYYPFGRDFMRWYEENPERLGMLFLTEKLDGVEVRRCNLYKPKKPGVLARITHEASFVLTTTLKLFSTPDKYDVVFCVSPPLLLGLPAWAFARLKKAHFIFHVKDLQPDAAVELGMLKPGLLTAVLYAVEKFIYTRADAVLTISEGMREKILAKGINESRVGLFHDWSNPEKLRPLERKNSFSKKHGLDDKFVVLHAGNMGEKQDMQAILEAAKKMEEDKDILFLLVGRGTKRAFVEDYVKENKLDNVLLLGVQPEETLSEMFSACDAALVTQKKNVRDIVMPSKTFGPASCKRPLIIAASDDCEITRITRKHEFGLTIPPEDSGALASAIYNLKENKGLAEKLGRNGRRFMTNERDMEKIIDRFEETFINAGSAAKR